jgi:hypothetical protein
MRVRVSKKGIQNGTQVSHLSKKLMGVPFLEMQKTIEECG